MKNFLWLVIGFGVAWYLITQKYGSFQNALAAWQPSTATTVSTTGPALASGGQGSGSLAPESAFYVAQPASFQPVAAKSGNSAAVGAQHVNPINNTRRSLIGGVATPKATLTPIPRGRQVIQTSHSGKAAKTFTHNVIGPIGTA